MNLNNISLMFCIGSFAFIVFLFSITFYEVAITKYLTEDVDTPLKWEVIHQKYSNLGFHNYFNGLFITTSAELDKILIENEEFEDEEDRHDMYEEEGEEK